MFGCTCARARRSAAAPGPGPGARGRGAGGAGRTTHSRWFRISRSTLLFTPARARALQPLAARRGCARQHGAARSGSHERAGPPEPRSRNCGRAARAQQRQARASRGERQREAHDSGRQQEQSGGQRWGRRTFIATCARTHRPDSAISLCGRRCDARQVHPGHCMACETWYYVEAALPSGGWPQTAHILRGCFASRTAAWQRLRLPERDPRGATPRGPALRRRANIWQCAAASAPHRLFDAHVLREHDHPEGALVQVPDFAVARVRRERVIQVVRGGQALHASGRGRAARRSHPATRLLPCAGASQEHRPLTCTADRTCLA